MAMEFDAIVVGGGLAGLGVSTSLVEDHDQKVVVLDKCKPEFNGNDRFNPDVSASFKNAGMCDLGHLQGVKSYFVKETTRRYKELGVGMRNDGGYVLAASRVNALLADVMLERLSRKEWATEEPNVDLASNRATALKFKTGSQAEPEATMKVIFDYAQGLQNLDLRYGEEVVTMVRNEDTWEVTTSSGSVFKAPKLVIAAGHASSPMLKKLRLDLRVENVYGIISQSNELDESQNGWLQGSIIGAKSYIFFCMQQLLCFCSNTLEATSWFGESGSWTTHLYMNVYNNRIYLGGPRIAMKEQYDESQITPQLYFDKIEETRQYAEDLVEFPPGVTFSPESTWGGFMAFPRDKDIPLVGPVEGAYDGSLYLSTGFASCGFREAFGAGTYCAGAIMSNGVQEYVNTLQDDDVANWRETVPALGRRVRRL